MTERIERARRAKMALDEFLTPALDMIEAEYGEKMIASAASVDPRAPDVIARLANGIKVARQIRSQIEAIVADGRIAESERDRTRKQDEMTPAKLRLMRIGAS